MTDATPSAQTLPGDLPAPLHAALTGRGYATLTAVQTAVIAPDCAGADLLVSAQTGSGKTVAFGLAIAHEVLGGLDRLMPPDLPLALVVAPTRELALQVRSELEWLYAEAGAVIASCVGGMDPRAERRQLERGAHIVVGTPGRLCDHLRRNALDLSMLRAAVLDEADEMLDLGFREDLEFILQSAAAERRTLLFSATVRPEIEQLARSYQKDARRIATANQREQHADIEYRGVLTATEDRENAIVNLLRFHEARTAIVFCGTRATVNHLTARFQNRGFSVVALSGEMDQRDRAAALQALRDGRARVCIATDVAARGIDLPGLELVIHADLPTNKETLLHRSGRTGRAGNRGISALIVPLNQRSKAQRLLGWAGVSAEWGPAPSAEAVLARDAERLLGETALTNPVTAEEAEAMGETAAALAAMPPRQLAAAVWRLWNSGRSAPEELRNIEEGGRRDHNEFGPSFWIVLSVGHSGRAEARWLLPLLCRTGDLSRRDIGAIRVGREETLVQLSAATEAQFFAGVGATMELEGGIAVTRLEGEPKGIPGNPEAAPRANRRMGAPRDDDRGPRKPRFNKPANRDGDFESRPPREPRPYGERAQEDRPYQKRAPRAEGPADGEAPRGWGPKAKKAPGAKYGTPSGARGPKPGGFKAGKPGGFKSGPKPGGKGGFKSGPKSRG